MRPTLLGVPYDDGSCHLRGAADAPPLIRRALWPPASNSWSELGVDVRGQLDDAGDLVIPADANPRDVIEAAVAALLDRGTSPIVLGGDHSITHPVVRAFHRRRPAFDVLHIDAHPDLYDESGGDRYSHACPFARIMEEGLAADLVQAGIRTMNGHQREQARRLGVNVITIETLFADPDAPCIFAIPLE